MRPDDIIRWAISLAWLTFALVATPACGEPSFYTSAPADAPDGRDCHDLRHVMSGKTIHTPTAIAWSGVRRITLYYDRPTNWARFSGSLYLLEAEWDGDDVDWIDYVTVYLDATPVATWKGEDWEIASGFDFAPFVDEVGGRLAVRPKFKAAGVKPAGSQWISLSVTVRACGPGASTLH